MTTTKLTSILESILFVAGKQVEESDIIGKLTVTKKEFRAAVEALKQKYNAQECGINLMEFNGKLQLCSNPNNIREVQEVLNPVMEKELTKAMLETLAIIAYKQPVTRLEVEDIRGVDSTYAVQNLSKMGLIEMVGRKDAVGKPILFGTTDEFLKRFALSDLDELPDYEELLNRIKLLGSETMATTTDLYNSNRDTEFDPLKKEEEVPEFLQGEEVTEVE